MIDTTRVHGRRVLRFESLEEMLRDARACAEAATLKQLGNWTLGTTLAHLAAWADYPYMGYPEGLDFPEEVKVRARANLGAILQRPMPLGERLPGAAAGTFGVEEATSQEGLARLALSVERLRSGDPPLADPVFGPLTAEQWTLMTLRHAELHLSFYVPG